MLDEAKTDIRIRKAVTDDLIELSDFILPFVQRRRAFAPHI